MSFISHHWLEWAGLVLVVAVVEWVGLLSPARRLSEWLVRPVLQGGVSVAQTFAWPVNVVRSAHRSASRIQELEQRYAEAAATLGRLTAVEAENQALRELLGSRTTQTPPAALTTPILSLAVPAVAAGEAMGVQPGDMVLVHQTLVGTILSVTPNQAEVVLLAQAGSPPVLAKTQTGIQGIVRGRNQRLFLDEVPLNDPVAVGELITSVGQPGIDQDILIGRVQRVEVDPSHATQTIFLDQVVSFYQAKVVEIR